MINNQQLIEHAILSLAAGKEDTARRLLVNLVATEPTNLLGWLYLAATLPPEKAVQALRRVLILDPQHPIALRNLQKLRTHPGTHLDLADVIANEDIFDEDALATFGEEAPTIFQPELFKEKPKPLSVVSMPAPKAVAVAVDDNHRLMQEFADSLPPLEELTEPDDECEFATDSEVTIDAADAMLARLVKSESNDPEPATQAAEIKLNIEEVAPTEEVLEYAEAVEINPLIQDDIITVVPVEEGIEYAEAVELNPIIQDDIITVVPAKEAIEASPSIEEEIIGAVPVEDIAETTEAVESIPSEDASVPAESVEINPGAEISDPTIEEEALETVEANPVIEEAVIGSAEVVETIGNTEAAQDSLTLDENVIESAELVEVSNEESDTANSEVEALELAEAVEANTVSEEEEISGTVPEEEAIEFAEAAEDVAIVEVAEETLESAEATKITPEEVLESVVAVEPEPTLEEETLESAEAAENNAVVEENDNASVSIEEEVLESAEAAENNAVVEEAIPFEEEVLETAEAAESNTVVEENDNALVPTEEETLETTEVIESSLVEEQIVESAEAAEIIISVPVYEEEFGAEAAKTRAISAKGADFGITLPPLEEVTHSNTRWARVLGNNTPLIAPTDIPEGTLKPARNVVTFPLEKTRIEDSAYLISSNFGASDSSGLSAGLREATTPRYTWLKNQAPLKYPQARRYKGPQRTHTIFTGFGVIMLMMLLLLIVGYFYFVAIPR